MSQQVRSAEANRELCFSSGALQDFLRLSRSSMDDSISQNLNAIVTPAAAGFDPNSTSRRSQAPIRRPINTRLCRDFTERVLFPTWKSRTDILAYCSRVAAKPDQNDSEVTRRTNTTLQDQKNIVDARLDPYANRPSYHEGRTETLVRLLAQEKAVEEVVRSRTWGVLQDRCGISSHSWDEAFRLWLDSQ